MRIEKIINDKEEKKERGPLEILKVCHVSDVIENCNHLFL
jgi:hypothetical protein